MFIEGRRGDRQNPADRLDPILGPVIVDERDHRFSGRSSSAWAKYALAFLRRSFACRSYRTSRSRSLIRARSSDVTPSRQPVSASSCWTQRRNVSRPTDSRSYPDCQALSARLSRVSQVNSGSLCCLFPWLQSFLDLEPPENPVRFIATYSEADRPETTGSGRAEVSYER